MEFKQKPREEETPVLRVSPVRMFVPTPGEVLIRIAAHTGYQPEGFHPSSEAAQNHLRIAEKAAGVRQGHESWPPARAFQEMIAGLPVETKKV
jgi:hypothetical protein